MKNVLIIEHNPTSLKPINESAGKGQEDKYTLGGVFTEFDKKNRNDRVYTWSKFEPALNELNERISTMGVYGEYDHPDTFDTSLKNASHMVETASYDEKNNCVTGKIRLLNTQWGKEAKALVEDNSPLFVSSRAAGITEGNGEVTLKKLFTYDIVADPGFSSARMQSLNESMGYSSNSNFQIYEMDDETKINQLFEMNKNDMVTKQQMVDYSEYLVENIKEVKAKINESIKTGQIQPKKLNELTQYYERMLEEQNKMTKYLDYLAENLQVVVKENIELKESNSKLEKTTNNLIKHNDYLAENLEKSIEFSDYIAEELDKSVEYSEYIAEELDKSIQYGEYIAEELDKSIQYGEYIAENLNKSIEFSDYLAENLDNSIVYSEYLAENIDTNIKYSEYIAENLDSGLAYTDYVAEQLDKSIEYSKMITEKLNESSSKLFESVEGEEMDGFPSPDIVGLSELEMDMEEDEDEDEDNLDINVDVDVEIEGSEDDVNCRVVCDDDEDVNIDDTPELEEGETEEIISDELDEEEEEMEEKEELEEAISEEVSQEEAHDEDKDECKDCEEEKEEEEEEDLMMENNLSKSIDQLILEAKKREASKTNEPNFLSFLNKDQLDSFYALENDDRELVIAHINEKGNYYSTSDVLTLMNEALATKEKSLEERLVDEMPEEVKDKWEKITESAKNSILSQARLHPTTNWNEATMEHFWLTRKFPAIRESNRELINKEDRLILEDSLSDDAMNSIMEKFNSIK